LVGDQRPKEKANKELGKAIKVDHIVSNLVPKGGGGKRIGWNLGTYDQNMRSYLGVNS